LRDKYHAHVALHTTKFWIALCQYLRMSFRCVIAARLVDDDSSVPSAKGVNVQRRDSGSNWGKPKSRETVGGRRAAMRVVQVGSQMVVVYEQEPTAADTGSRTLVFESG
jgi:hypothetical protein